MNINQNSNLSRDFAEFILNLQNAISKSDIPAFFDLILSALEEKTLIPVGFSKNKQGKIVKKPLIAWKDENVRILAKEEFLKLKEDILNSGKTSVGIAINLDEFEDLEVIDIDKPSEFLKYFSILTYEKEKGYLLNPYLKNEVFLFVKTFRGYHIYLKSKKNFKKALELNKISKTFLLETFGFEIKSDGLLIIPPSTFEDKSYKLVSGKKTPTYPYQIFAEIIDKLKQKITEQKNADLEVNLRTHFVNFEPAKKLVEKIKSEVKFKDLLPTYFVDSKARYDRYHCPFHPPDNVPSFFVYHNDGSEIAFDAHTGETYDVIGLYQKIKEISNFKEALSKMKTEFSISVSPALRKELKTFKELDNSAFFRKIEYLFVPDFLIHPSLILVFGLPKVGKTKLISYLCFCLSHNQNFLGLFEPKKQRKVCYFGEQDPAFWFNALISLGIEPNIFDFKAFKYANFEDIEFIHKDFISQVEEKIKEGYEIFVLDPVVLDPGKSKEYEFGITLQRLTKERNITIILIAHERKKTYASSEMSLVERYSGTMAFPASVDINILIEKVEYKLSPFRKKLFLLVQTSSRDEEERKIFVSLCFKKKFFENKAFEVPENLSAFLDKFITVFPEILEVPFADFYNFFKSFIPDFPYRFAKSKFDLYQKQIKEKLENERN